MQMPDGSLIIQIVNFVVLIFILNFVLYKPIRTILNQRKEKVTGLENSIDSLSKDAKEKEAAFGDGIKAARTKGLAEKKALMTAAAEEEKKIVEKINNQALADLQEVRGKIAKDVESVRASLMKEVDTFANAIGEKILGRAV